MQEGDSFCKTLSIMVLCRDDNYSMQLNGSDWPVHQLDIHTICAVYCLITGIYMSQLYRNIMSNILHSTKEMIPVQQHSFNLFVWLFVCFCCCFLNFSDHNNIVTVVFRCYWYTAELLFLLLDFPHETFSRRFACSSNFTKARYVVKFGNLIPPIMHGKLVWWEFISNFVSAYNHF